MWKKFVKKYFRRKSVATLIDNAQSSKLKKTMGAFQVALLGIGCIIGAGIFVLTGAAASLHAGPSVSLSFALSGVICICAGLCYAEFASMIPISGSSYTYTYVTLGELPAWIIGSVSATAYFLGAVSVATGWSSYLVSFLNDFGINLPLQFIYNAGHEIILENGKTTEAIFNVPAFAISIISAFILCHGMKTSSLINTFIVFIKMVVLFTFVVVGITKINTENWMPFIPANTGEFGQFGISGIIAGASMVFLAYNGFDSICTAAQETKNPQRDLPIGIIGAIAVSTIVYVLVALVLTGLVHYSELNSPEPIAIAVDKIGIPWFSTFVKIGAIAGLTSVILISEYAIVRMVYTITRDKLLPAILGKIHAKYRTPHIATLIIGFLIGVISATCSLEKVVKLSSFFILFTLIMVCVSAVYLRYKKPQLKRNFKCPFMPWIPLISIALCMQMIFSLPLYIIFHAIAYIVLVIVFYFIYGRHHSPLTSK